MSPVTLEIFIGHKASLHVLKVWVKLKKLGYVDSKRKFRPDFFGAINEFAPTGREFRITRITISFIAELETGDNTLVVIVDNPLDDFNAFIYPHIGRSFKTDENLNSVRFIKIKCLYLFSRECVWERSTH